MSRATLSCKLFRAVFKVLPEPIASKVVKFLGLKIPTQPSLLAATLFRVAGGLAVILEEELDKSDDETATLLRCDYAGAVLEVLTAYYCLAVAVLGEDELARELKSWNRYTATTFEEMKKLLKEMESSAQKGSKTQLIGIYQEGVLERATDEATELYLRDKPTLAELVQAMPDYVLGYEVAKVNTNDWFPTFLLKAQTRILGSLGVKGQSLSLYLILGTHIKSQFISCVKLFREMRPVFMDPERKILLSALL
jgi:hypothetical protein